MYHHETLAKRLRLKELLINRNSPNFKISKPEQPIQRFAKFSLVHQ